jgi:NAD(P)H-dependent FMN reductase
MAKLIGLSGSLQRGSFNMALLRAAVEWMPDGAELSHYDADAVFSSSMPAPFKADPGLFDVALAHLLSLYPLRAAPP